MNLGQTNLLDYLHDVEVRKPRKLLIGNEIFHFWRMPVIRSKVMITLLIQSVTTYFQRFICIIYEPPHHITNILSRSGKMIKIKFIVNA